MLNGRFFYLEMVFNTGSTSAQWLDFLPIQLLYVNELTQNVAYDQVLQYLPW